MAKFIIDTDLMAIEAKVPVEITTVCYIMDHLRAAHGGNKDLPSWLTPYPPQKKRGMSGTGPYSYLFESFWAAYPPRNGVKSGKRPAFKAWVKIFTTTAEEGKLLDDCRSALLWQKAQENWTKNNGSFIPMATTYLNAEGWTDEQPKGPGSGNKIAKTY